MPEANTLQDRISAIVEPIADELGLVVHDVEVHPSAQLGKVVVVLDRRGVVEPGNGITISEITSVTRQLGDILDAEDLLSFAYRLEVTSPGIERELKRPKHFADNIGENVKLVLRRATADGDRVLRGVLQGTEGDEVVVQSANGDVRVPFDAIKKARTIYDFDSAGKKSRGARKARVKSQTAEKANDAR